MAAGHEGLSWPGVDGLERAVSLAPTLPHSCILTDLQGVECGLAHGFVGMASGDGDTAGHRHGLLTGEAL